MPNPQVKEYGLKHQFSYHWAGENYSASELQIATMLPLHVCDGSKDKASAEAINVHPLNPSKTATVTHPNCHVNSRINRLKITEYHAVLSQADLQSVMFTKALISFGTDMYKEEATDGTTLLTSLKLTKGTNTIHPTYNGTKLSSANYCHASQEGLTTNQILEGVTVRPSDLMEERYNANRIGVKKALTGPMRNLLTKDFPMFREQWYDTSPQCRRMNSFTGCFLYIGMEDSISAGLANTANNFGWSFDQYLTADESVTEHHVTVEFTEYHDWFNQETN